MRRGAYVRRTLRRDLRRELVLRAGLLAPDPGEHVHGGTGQSGVAPCLHVAVVPNLPEAVDRHVEARERGRRLVPAVARRAHGVLPGLRLRRGGARGQRLVQQPREAFELARVDRGEAGEVGVHRAAQLVHGGLPRVGQRPAPVVEPDQTDRLGRGERRAQRLIGRAVCAVLDVLRPSPAWILDPEVDRGEVRRPVQAEPLHRAQGEVALRPAPLEELREQGREREGVRLLHVVLPGRP